MSTERAQLEAGIAALEAQRAVLGDVVVDASLASLRARLAALISAEEAQTLKQVSILFLDVVGSTTLSRMLDPEDISAVMDGALARATAIVTAHRGKVLQYAGDSLLAAFGADGTQEDDAERAVLCGLALLSLGKVLGTEVEETHGHAGFDVRLGVHTGEVLLGGGVDAEGTIRGIAVNIAARMEQTAPTGTLRISHDTYLLIRGRFDVEPQPPLTVKGLEAPLQSYLVGRVKPRTERAGARGIEGLATRMVGRKPELDALQRAYRRLLGGGNFAVLTVAGEAGLGKSRLGHEFEDWRRAEAAPCRVFAAQASPQTATRPYGLLREVLFSHCQIGDEDNLAAARRRWETTLMPLFQPGNGPERAAAEVHLLGHLLALDWRDSPHLQGILDDPGQIRHRAFHAAAQLFRRVAGETSLPVLLVLEDLHWADDETLAFLEHLAEANQDQSMLVLTFTRPTLFERHPQWPRAPGRSARVDLAPLGERDSDVLIEELLKPLPAIPPALRELLRVRADGNPFYLEELLRMLIDEGAVVPGEPWSVNLERLRLTRVPPTLTGVLQARLDALPASERRTLQQASVVGSVFWEQALAAIDAGTVQALPMLTHRGLTLPRDATATPGLTEYAFRHHLLQQTTYDTLLKRHKREGHARVGRWLAALIESGRLRSGDFLALAAQHFDLADERQEAVAYYARAVEQASERFAHERVLNYATRALHLLGPARRDDAALRWRLLSEREKTLELQGARDAQAADLDALATLAEWLDDDRRRADVALRRSGRAMRMTDWVAQAEAAREAMTCARRAGDDEMRLRALRFLAMAQVDSGELEAGKALALDGLAEARRLRLRGAESRLLNALSIVADCEGNLVDLLVVSRQARELDRAAGDRISESIALVNAGTAALMLGDFAGGSDLLEAALALARANGDRSIEGFALGSLALLSLWQENFAESLRLAGMALAIANAGQARDMEARARLLLGDTDLALGHEAAARAHFTAALSLAREIESPWQREAAAGLARVALAEDDPEEALAALAPILAQVNDGSARAASNHLVELTCHRALARAGDPRAAAWLARAYQALMAQADDISRRLDDPDLRQAFLTNIPQHREIRALWAARPAAERPQGAPGR